MAPAVIQNQYLDGQAHLDCSNETAATVDAAVKKLINNCYDESVRLLTENRALLDEIAAYLLTKETITGEELMNFVRRPSEESAETAEAAVPAEAATEITAAAQTEVPTEPEE
jgi:cell division protease FtsH